MLPNVKNFYRPAGLADAVKLLSSDTERNVVLGGGTQLALSTAPGIDGLVDLRSCGLDYRKVEGNVVVLGARCRPADAIQFEGLKNCADGIVVQASSNYLAEVQRNRASLGGILVAAAAWADIATALLAAGGEVVIVDAKGERKTTIDEFLSVGPAKASHRALIKELRVATGGKGSYARLSKTETDISILSVCARIDASGGKVTAARIAIGGATPLPVRSSEAEKKIVGSALTAASAEAAAEAVVLDAIADIRATAEYRAEVAKVLVKRCLTDIAGRMDK